MRVSDGLAWLLISCSATVIYISGLLICLLENRAVYEFILVILGIGLGFSLSSIIVNFTIKRKENDSND